jgi:hypothetical protein
MLAPRACQYRDGLSETSIAPCSHIPLSGKTHDGARQCSLPLLMRCGMIAPTEIEAARE